MAGFSSLIGCYKHKILGYLLVIGSDLPLNNFVPMIICFLEMQQLKIVQRLIEKCPSLVFMALVERDPPCHRR